MKRHLTYIMFGTTLLLVYCLFWVNLYVYASDVPYIAFSSNRDWNYDIYIMDIKGRNLQNLTNSSTHEFSPAFSPDGQQMAYVSSRHERLEIYVMNLNTKVSRRLTHHPKHDNNPAWSPDGRWIAFDSNREGTYDIYKIEPDGENLQRLTHEGDNFNPAWSPDNQFIASSSSRGVGKGGIYIMDADGGNPRRLANQPRWGQVPSWSPDGKQIAFSDLILGGNRDVLLMPNGDIYTINVDGSHLRQRTRHQADDFSPVWSPDGRSIVYDSMWNEKYDIYLIEDGRGRNTGRLTRHPADDKNPTWVPAGYFSVSPTAETQTTLWGRLKQSIHD